MAKTLKTCASLLLALCTVSLLSTATNAASACGRYRAELPRLQSQYARCNARANEISSRIQDTREGAQGRERAWRDYNCEGRPELQRNPHHICSNIAAGRPYWEDRLNRVRSEMRDQRASCQSLQQQIANRQSYLRSQCGSKRQARGNGQPKTRSTTHNRQPAPRRHSTGDSKFVSGVVVPLLGGIARGLNSRGSRGHSSTPHKKGGCGGC